MSLEFRTATIDELAGAVDVVSTAFLDRPDLDRLATSVRETWDLDRTWIARDGDLTCGVWRSWATEITVPGGAQLPAAAVGPVTVLPTHRRRGAFKGMTAGAHASIRDMGDAMALLNASEWGIYGRYGYGPATRRVDWTIRTVPAGGIHGQPAGTVELVPPAEARETLDRHLRGVAHPPAGRDPAARPDAGSSTSACGWCPGRARPGRAGSWSTARPTAPRTATPDTPPRRRTTARTRSASPGWRS